VPPGDGAALAAGIVRVLDDPTGAAAMARKGRAQMVERFDIRRVMPRYEALYDELLAGRA
jgi:glycosyltransferase involved in cell wall biosynthesis